LSLLPLLLLLPLPPWLSVGASCCLVRRSFDAGAPLSREGDGELDICAALRLRAERLFSGGIVAAWGG